MFGPDTWHPIQYARFQREREQPFFDLMALVHAFPDLRVVDLGCGTGKQTRLLHEHLRARDTLGIDRSPRMLESMGAADLPAGLRFTLGTIEAFAARDEYDLVFSNAALHWVDDHERLIPRLAAALSTDGQLAFQVPASHDDPPHVVADELTGIEPFKSALGGWRLPQPVLKPEQYARLLYRTGFQDPKVRLVIYPHVLSAPEEVVEWMKGSLLSEYERHLPVELFATFVEEYRTRLLARLDQAHPFFFPFKRILCWGQKC